MKLIAIDLDGTLLNERGLISAENVEAIKQAQNHGNKVAIATGRALMDVEDLLHEVNLDCPIISSNGAHVLSDNNIIKSDPLSKVEAEYILKYLEENDFYYEVTTDRAIYTPHDGKDKLAVEMDFLKSANPELREKELWKFSKGQYRQFGISFINNYQEVINSDLEIYKILAFSFHEEKRNNGWNYLKDMNGMVLVSSAIHNFELSNENATKGNALKALSSHLTIPMEETIAIGDSGNDVSMLKVAGLSIAMGNAPSEIKNIADKVTLTNDEHGVAHAIHNFLLEVTKQH
mgnify:CR=1 FL=1